MRWAIHVELIHLTDFLLIAEHVTGIDALALTRNDRTVIERNGRTWNIPTGGQDEQARVIEDLAAGIMSEPDFMAWVSERIS